MTVPARLGVGVLVIAATMIAAAPVNAATADKQNLSFGNQQVGTESGVQVVTLTGIACGPSTPTNPDPCAPYNTTASLDIAVSGPFRITANNCPIYLFSPTNTAPQCTIGVAFAPTGVGVLNGFLRYSSNPIRGVPLSGVGFQVVTPKTGKKKCKKGKARASKKCKKKGK